MKNLILFIRWVAVVILILWPTSNFINWILSKVDTGTEQELEESEENKNDKMVGRIDFCENKNKGNNESNDQNKCISTSAKIYYCTKNDSSLQKKKDDKTGRWIGRIERIILLICIAGNHYEALGFIIAAKTLTRFKEIEADKTFGDKYLLGTLLSVASVMVIYYLIIGIWY